jgi:SAM-dependent methyltransferase
MTDPKILKGSSLHSWNSVAAAWQQSQPQALWRKHSDAVNLALISQWLPVGRVERILKTDLFDEAFSDGLLPMLVSRAHQVVGMDASVKILVTVRSSYTMLRTVGADVRCLPFADSVFDVVVSNSTLDHFATRKEIVTSLHELHRVLRPEGLLVLTLDNLGNPIVTLRQLLPFPLLNRFGIVPYYVGATFDQRGLCRIMDQVGLEVCKVSAVMHCPRVLAVALASLIDKYGKEKTKKRFLRALIGFERLSLWPTRFLTGHFVAVMAEKV